MIYYIVFAGLWISAFCEILGKKESGISGAKKSISFVVMLMLIIMAGLRDGVGRDFLSYQFHYELIHSDVIAISNESLEVGYSILNYISPSFRFVILFMAIFSIYLRYRSFEPLSCRNMIFLPLLFYYASDFLFYDMGVIRQGIAMSLCFFSIRYIIKRDAKFFVYILIASLFHWSAIFFVLLYFISNKEYPRKVYYIVFAITIFVFLFGRINTEFIQKILETFHLDLVLHKFNKFLNYENGSVNLTFFRRMLFAIFFIEIFKRPKIRCGAGVIPKRKQTEYTWLYINAFVLAIIMFSVTSNVFSAISGRVSAMFYSFYIFIYSDIFSDKRLKGFHIIYFLIFTALLFYSFNREIYNPNANFLPYTIRFL